MPFGNAGKNLPGKKSQALFLITLGADVGDIIGGHGSNRCTIGVIRGFVNDMLQHGDAEPGRYRIGHRQPDTVAERRK